MTHVFVSYSRRDKEVVDRIVAAMEQTGMKIWIDREDIKAGNSWRVQIVEAIDTCDAFVLMLSSNSAISENVQKEIILAQDSTRKTFVVLLEPVKMPAEIRYQLAGLQFIEFQALGFDKASSQLTNTVAAHLSSLESKKKATRQVELVIEGIDLAAFDADKQDQLLDFIAKLGNTDKSALKIASLAPGSVHVTVEMPAEPAFQLKTAALNRDKRFKNFGIKALRIIGDAKYVYIPLGVLIATAKLGILQLLWLQIPALLPFIFGSTVGKGITVLLITSALAAAAVAVPTTIVPALFPSPTATQTSTPTNTPTLTATATQTPTLTLTSTPSLTPSQTQTPTLTPTPTITFTPTIDRSPNSLILYSEGAIGDVFSCEEMRFAAHVSDPEGISRVLVQFIVSESEPTPREFLNPDAEIDLLFEGGDLWGRTFTDTFSIYQMRTYWRFLVIDQFRTSTFYYEPGRFSYFAAEVGCIEIPQ